MSDDASGLLRTSVSELPAADIIALGKRKTLELCFVALETFHSQMVGGNAAAAVSAARAALAAAAEGPFALDKGQHDDMEGARLEARAKEALAEVLAIAEDAAARGAGEDGADDAGADAPEG